MLLEPLNGTFQVGCIYGRADDAARFSYFCGAASDYLRIADIQCVFRLARLLRSLLPEIPGPLNFPNSRCSC